MNQFVQKIIKIKADSGVSRIATVFRSSYCHMRGKDNEVIACFCAFVSKDKKTGLDNPLENNKDWIQLRILFEF